MDTQKVPGWDSSSRLFNQPSGPIHHYSLLFAAAKHFKIFWPKQQALWSRKALSSVTLFCKFALIQYVPDTWINYPSHHRKKFGFYLLKIKYLSEPNYNQHLVIAGTLKKRKLTTCGLTGMNLLKHKSHGTCAATSLWQKGPSMASTHIKWQKWPSMAIGHIKWPSMASSRVPTKIRKQFLDFSMTDLLFSMTPILTWFQMWLWLYLTTCMTITNYKAAIAMRTSNSMTFWEIFIFQDFSMTAMFSRIFHDRGNPDPGISNDKKDLVWHPRDNLDISWRW